jgi:hypothetical protein
MVDYLARNQEILGKLQGVVDPLIITGNPTGESSKHYFVPVTSLELEDKQETFVGMKVPSSDINQ